MLSPACASHSHSVHVTVREHACVFLFFIFQLPERTGNWFFNGQSVVTIISGRKRKEEEKKKKRKKKRNTIIQLQEWRVTLHLHVGYSEIVYTCVGKRLHTLPSHPTLGEPQGFTSHWYVSVFDITTHTHARTHARTHTRTRTHARIHTRTHARTHTHTRTHTRKERERERERTVALLCPTTTQAQTNTV